MKFCPTCQREMPRPLFVTGTRRRQFVDALLRHPDGMTCRQLMDLIYADDRGGGPISDNIIAVMATHLRRQLKPQGYTVKSTGGPGSIYRLIPVPTRQSLDKAS